MAGSAPMGYVNDGYSVVIDPDKLLAMAAHIKGQHPNVIQMRNHLLDSLVPEGAFGTIPGGREARGRLYDAMNNHLNAIDEMGVSIADFAARVQAAHELAARAEPATVAVSIIPAPLNPPTGQGG